MALPGRPRQFAPDALAERDDPRLPARFWEKADEDANGCWTWTGKCNRGGYGLYDIGYKRKLAHRVAYEALVGPVPLDLQLDHLCRVKHCVNPNHLEPVTAADNVRRKPDTNKTHCPKDHPLDGDNLYVNPKGYRECRECRRAHGRAFRAGRKAAS